MLDIPDEVLSCLRREAVRRGIGLGDLIADLASMLLGSPRASRGEALGFVAIGASVSDQCAGDADEMLAGGFGRT